MILKIAMFKSKDRNRLLNYLSKKTPDVQPIKKKATSISPTSSSNHEVKPKSSSTMSLPRQHDVSPSTINVTSPTNKSDDLRKLKKRNKNKSMTNIVRKSGDQDDQIDDEKSGEMDATNASTKPVPSKKAKKEKKKKKKQLQATDKIVDSTSPNTTPKSINKAKRQRCREEALMNEVASILADYRDNGIRPEDVQEENNDFLDDLNDDQEVYEAPEEYIEEDEVFVEQSVSKKQKKNFVVPEEVNRRSSELGSKARQTLATSMFRSLNEFLYSNDTTEARKGFTANKFKLYHEAYDKLMTDWPLKPIDYLIDVLKVSGYF